MKIRLTESELIDLLEEVLLVEAMSLKDVYAKYYSEGKPQHIPEEIFYNIAEADPTRVGDGKGKYTEWLISLYRAGKLKTEDLYKATQYLEAFHKFKNRIEQKDIRTYKSLPELYRVVKPFIDNPGQATSKSDEIRRIKEGAEKVYEDERWLIIVPHTKEAAIEYGKNTQWCTAASESENYFDYYLKDYGDSCLFINIDKKNNHKYQFCFDSDEFMDETDDQIEWPIAETIGLTQGALNFYKPICGDLLTLDYNPDEIIEIDGLDHYYLTPNRQTIIKEVGGGRYKEVCTFPIVGEELGCEFYHDCICHRFIPVYDNDETVLNIFDLTTKSLIFKSDDYICDINYFNNSNYIICKRFVDYYTDDPICSVFSLDKMKFTCNVPDYNLYLLNASFADKSYYDDNIYIDTRYGSDGYRQVRVFDVETGKQIASGRGNSYTEYYYDNELPNGGKLLYFLAMDCPDVSGGSEVVHLYNTIVLYDGTLMSFDEFTKNKQKVLRQQYHGFVK